MDSNAITTEFQIEPLSIVLDSKPFFEYRINKLCEKASQTLEALSVYIFVYLHHISVYKKNCNKNIYNIPIWILPFSMNVS